MTGRAPGFWFRQPPSALAHLLTPLGHLYAGATAYRLRQTPVDAGLAVICCGNATAGGTGKTPTALYLLALLAQQGWQACALTRGHGGRQRGPVWVQPGDDATAVGDEALLLARQAPTLVARDRLAGARAAAAAGFDVAVMDDGLQHPQPARALNLLVVDGARGFGNGRIIPAGPLREPLARAAARCRHALVIGEDATGAAAQLPGELAVLTGDLALTGDVPPGPLLAFAGLGRPEKFFASLDAAGNPPKATAAFPDHHAYSRAELDKLARAARALGAQLVTTAKDYERLPAAWAKAVTVLDGRLVLAPAAAEQLSAAVARALGADAPSPSRSPARFDGAAP